MNNQLKVFHFISSLQRGGRERQLCTIYKFNDQEKQEIKIIYLNDSSSNYIDEFQIRNNHLIKIKSKKSFSRIRELYLIIKNEKPDIIYAWGSLEATYSLLLKLFNNFIFINGSIRHGVVAKKLSHFWRSVMLHFSKNIVANSKAGLKANGIKRGYLLYNGIDEKFFHKLQPNSETILFNQKLMNPVFISVANLVPYKDYFTVLKALNSLKQEGHDFSYIIIGEGPNRLQLEHYVKEFNLKEHVHLLGVKSNVSDYLSLADIFIHSSKGEGCSNAILEAMSAGLPVIASNTGGTSEIIKIEYGRLFEYQNVLELKEIMLELMVNKEQIIEMGVEAQKKAQKNYSVHSMINNYYQIINDIVIK